MPPLLARSRPNMTKRNNLRLQVTNFGPIAAAEIDLRPLTVFVGPSNTGKSYLAILIYALHRLFNGNASILPELLGSTIAASPFFAHGLIEGSGRKSKSEMDIDLLVTWAGKLQHQINNNDYRIEVPRDVMSLISSSVSLPGFEDPSAVEIRRCFNIDDVQRLISRNGALNSSINIVKQQQEDKCLPIAPLTYSYAINNTGFNFISSVSEHIPERILGEYRKTPDDDVLINRLSPYDLELDEFFSDEDQDFIRTIYGMPRYAATLLTPVLAHIVGSAIVGPLDRIAYYLPADRAGVMHAHRIVVSSLISRASHAGLRPETPRAVLSGVMADFLETLIGLGDLPAEPSPPDHEISARLERGMLRGEILSEKSEVGYPVFSYRPRGWKENIPLINSSSMVSELAPVILYLRHVVRPGEVLIIEEPEAHLHPAMQVEFIRQLAAAVRAGIRVMLTTHSEWVLEELANLVRLSDLPESQWERVASADVAIMPEEVGVWLFRHDDASGGSKVQEIRLDVDSGGFPTEYDDVAMDTYNKWARIGNLLEGTDYGS